MSAPIDPENQEDVQQQIATDAAIGDAVPTELVCPSIDIVFPEFPDFTELKSLMESGVGAAQALKARVLTPPDPEAAVNEAKDAVSDQKTKLARAVGKAAKDLKDGANAVKAAAEAAILAELGRANTAIRAIGQGIIDIGTDLENIDQLTIDAIGAQFPGYKNPVECLFGPADSGAAIANSQDAKEQINTPVPDNPAKVKSDVADAIVPPTTEEVEAAQEQQGKTLNPFRSIEGEFRTEYPYVLVDPDDPNKVYAVYPGIPLVSIYDISSGKARDRGTQDINVINTKFKYMDIRELPVKKQRVDDKGEDAGDEVTELPE